MTTATEATSQIHHALDASGWLHPMTHDRVASAVGALTSPSLSPADANATIHNLAHTGDLDTLAKDLLGGGSYFGRGALSTTERGRFLADMAGKLDGKALADLSGALARTDRESGGHQYVAELGEAVAAHASPKAKLDYIRALSAKTTDQPSYNQLSIGGAAINYSDAEAVAVGDVLGSMRGAQAAQAFAALTPVQTRAVLTSAIEGKQSISGSLMPGGGSTSVLTYNASRFDRIMDAAASTGDARLKANVFDAGVSTLRSVRDTNSIFGGLTVIGQDATLKSMAAGLTRIVESDPNGVMGHLAYDRKTFDGGAFSTYAKEMLQSGQQAGLGNIMAHLQLGNDLQGNAITRFEATAPSPSGDIRHPTADALGYFVGAVYKASESISSDVRAQQDMATAVIKTALTVIDKSKLGGPAAGTAASIAKEWVSYAARAAIADPGNSAATQWERASLPIDPKTDQLAVGDASRTLFGHVIEETRRMAKP